MKSKILTCVAASALSLATTNAAIISVNFAGRADGTTNGVANSGGVIAPGDAAGVMNVANFNNILRSTYSPSNGSGQAGVTFTSDPLNDSTAAATTVIFNINASDSWNSESDTSTPNHTLLNGIIKANNVQPTVPLNILTLGVGTPYTLQVYTMENDGAVGGRYSITDGTSTFYQTSQTGQQYKTTPAFIKGANTDTTLGRPTANYVEFSGTVGANGQINVSYNYEGGSDGTGIAGFQLETIPEPSSLLLLGFASAGMFIRRRR